MAVYGLIGEQLGHSLSPEIHNHLFKLATIDAIYNLFCVPKEQSHQIVDSLKTLGIKGSNVTIPYKEMVMDQLDELSDEARKIGAVNTIAIREGKAIGYNTDYYGFGKILSYGNIAVQGRRFYVLGAGGAAKSIVWYLKDHGAKEVIIVSRDIAKAQAKFEKEAIGVIDYMELEQLESGEVIINTTPCGMYPKVDQSPVACEVLKKFEVAIDIVYNPEETLFLKEAKALGLQVMGGLWMLVGQAVKAESIWQEVDFKACYEKEIYDTLKENKRLRK